MATESKWNSKFNPKLQTSTKNWSTNTIPGTDNGIIGNQRIEDMKDQGNQCIVSFSDAQYAGFPNLTHTSGVMVIWLHDTLGPNNNEETSPMNMAWIEHKEFMDTALGQQFGYSAADLGQVVGGFKSMVDIYKVIKRILLLPNNPRTPISNYSIAGLYKGMRLATEDYDTDPLKVQREISRKRKNYVDDMNNIITLFDEAGIPLKLSPLMEVSDDYYSKVYLDATSENAQFYMFMPIGWYEYDETSDPAGAVLNYKNLYNDLNTPKADSSNPNYHNHTYSVQDLIDLFNQMVISLTQYSDSKAILQKLLNAYGTEKLYHIGEINMDDKVPYVYDAGFRNTIRNMAWFQDITYAKYTVDPNREIVIGGPVFATKQPTSTATGLNLVNLPLQFTEAPSKITDKMIADALVLHPVLGYVRRILDTSDNKWKCVFDFGNQFGFAIPCEVDMVGYAWESGVITWHEEKLANRSTAYSQGLLDWSFFPPTLESYVNSMHPGLEDVLSVQVARYITDRETELTVSNNDLKYWFRAFALGVYNTKERMQTKGQRSLMG